jgi:molybdopterin synthase sulfur carrier subunit
MTATTEITLRYFAWIREKTGLAQERLTLPPTVETVADLLAWQATRGPEFADAFAKPGIIRAAIDQRHVKPATTLVGAREIAFFPPVTGG